MIKTDLNRAISALFGSVGRFVGSYRGKKWRDPEKSTSKMGRSPNQQKGSYTRGYDPPIGIPIQYPDTACQRAYPGTVLVLRAGGALVPPAGRAGNERVERLHTEGPAN